MVANTFHDLFGDVRIRTGAHVAIVDGEPVVELEVIDVIGCS